MNDMTPTSTLTPLSVLAKEARVYSEGFAMNALGLGRVLTEAKKQVRHGEWADWVRENAGMSVRNAQQFMAIHARFGGKDAFIGLDRSKMYRLLSLPAGTEDDFVAQNDVAAMSSREVEEAVRRVRQEMGEQIAREKRARRDAEERASELELQADKVPDHIMDNLVSQQNRIHELEKQVSLSEHEKRLLSAEANGLRRDIASLERDVQERDDMLAEAQQEHERVCQDLLAMQSAAARGDAERVPAEELTADVFATAVRQFIGTCARMPHMAGAFSRMMLKEKNTYDELLRTVEGWARDARAALDTVDCGEVRVHG